MNDSAQVVPFPSERRKDGWTWTKEIVGTIVGVAAVMAIPTAWLFNTLTVLQTGQAVQDLRIRALEQAKDTRDRQMFNIDEKLGKIMEQISDVRVAQARQSVQAVQRP